MQGRLVFLSRFPERKKPAIVENCLQLTAGMGIVGDFHGDGNDNQISIMTKELKDWMDSQEVQGHCFRRFKENILIEGISLENCTPGDFLVCDEVVLEITDFVKRCYPEICDFSELGIPCIVPDGIRYARVVHGGELKTGRPIMIKKRKEN